MPHRFLPIPVLPRVSSADSVIPDAEIFSDLATRLSNLGLHKEGPRGRGYLSSHHQDKKPEQTVCYSTVP